MGDNHIKIDGSNLGALAVGDGATATGHVVVASSDPVSQADYERHIKGAEHALVDDRATLDELSAGLSEALQQFLTMARKIQVDQASMKEVQGRIKDTVDEVWAQHEAKGMKPQLIPKTLEIAGAIASNPLMLEVAKKLIAG